MIDMISNQFAAFCSNLADLIEISIKLPRALLGGRSRSSLFGRGLMVLFQVVWFPIYSVGWLLLAPLRFLTDFSPERRREFIYGIPVLLVLGFVGYVVIFNKFQSETIEKRYREKGQALMAALDFAKAKTYYGRIMSNSAKDVDDADVYNWAIILAKTGEPVRAAAILDRLAPFEKAGYHRAHQLKAVNLANSRGTSQDPMVLQKLRWHLENSLDGSAPTCQSWAVYYMALGQPENALPWLEKAADQNPANLIDVARLHKQLGNPSAEHRAVVSAEKEFRKLVEKDPLQTENRISLANVLVQLGKLNEAENVLLTGVQLQPDPMIVRSTSDYYVMRHDMARNNKDPFTQQFEFLRRAMELDVNYPLIYQRFVGLYQQPRSDEELSEIKSAILNTLAGDRPSALAHFALSNVFSLEGNGQQAEWHLEQAYNLEPQFVLVLNNLAWTLATKAEPELDRALDLATQVVDRVPDDGRFRDTYATVLMKQGKFQQAVLEFEKALLTITNKKPLHEKLANLYEQLGQHELANLHVKRAKDIQ